MPQPTAPQSQWNDRGASIVPALTRVYVIDRGTYYELSDTGPGTSSFVQVGAQWEIDPTGTARLAQSATHELNIF